jgi:hypothetical protein
MDWRDKQAEKMAAKRREERSIDVPECVDPERRARCKNDLILFANTYFREMPDENRYPHKGPLLTSRFSPEHELVLREFQARIMFGGQKSVAAFRGFGKDTLAVIACLWAISYGHTRFFVFACWEMSAAVDRIQMLKEQVEINRRLADDFPEMCAPIRALERTSQRCKAQTYKGEFTRSEWGNELVFPSIPGWAGSGCIVVPASLSGSVRGLNKNGERPTFVMISDPQTDESAKSPMQQADVMRRINKDLGGVGGHTKPMATLALVTIIRRGDVADLLTDSNVNPQWAGVRYPALRSWPENMELWEEYFELKKKGGRDGDASGKIARAFYASNRAAMDAGADVVWEDAVIRAPDEDGNPIEISALQHFMNLYASWGRDAFLTEYQHEPPAMESEEDQLTEDEVASRLSGHPQFLSPRQADILIRSIDVGARDLWVTTLAITPDASECYVVDYQRVTVRKTAEVDDLRQKGEGRQAAELAVLDALREIRDGELAGQYVDEDGAELFVDLTLVDSGYMEEVVYSFCGESGPKFRAIKGESSVTGSNKSRRPSKIPKRKGSLYWWPTKSPKGHPIWMLDTTHWKLHLLERLKQPMGSSGALSIFGASKKMHTWFAKHMVSERYEIEKNRFVKVSKFNHWLDTTSYCFAGADMLNVNIAPQPDRKKPVARISTAPPIPAHLDAGPVAPQAAPSRKAMTLDEWAQQ